MADWATFAVATVALTLLLLYLTRRSQRTLRQVRIVDDATDPASSDTRDGPPRTFDHPDAIDREFGENPPVSNAAEPFAENGDDPNGAAPTDDETTVDDVGSATGSAATDGNEDADGRGATDGTETADGRKATDGSEDADGTETGHSVVTIEAENVAASRAAASPDDRPVLTTNALLANVAVSQGLALGALVTIAWWTGVSASAFGVDAGDVGGAVLLLGIAAGVVLYAANEGAASVGERFGVTAPERLRSAMAPTDARGWAFLLAVVLPVIAVFEEALFRGALIGAFALGFGIDPWLLAVVSSVAFGLGHGAQGRLGVLVTGGLGVVLAGLFIVTGSLLVVIVAHYVINALEFLVREWLGWDPGSVGSTVGAG